MFRTIWAYLVYTWGGLHRYFGNSNHVRSEHETAVHYFAHATLIKPDFRQARLARGILLSRELERHDEALAEFNWLLAENAADGEVKLNRAMLYQQIGNFEAALVDFEAYAAQGGVHVDEVERTAVILRELLAEKNNHRELDADSTSKH